VFDELVKQIDDLLSKQDHVVIAISGFGGSGKSMLANRLRDKFKINDRHIVRLDNLFAEQPWGTGVFDDYDWSIITEILQKVLGRGFFGERISFDEPMPKVVIIEGVRLLRPEAIPYFDIKVWIDCPLNIATERGKARDRAGGADDAHIKRWDTEWTPKEEVYNATYHPDKLASFLYEEWK